jgi:hypothetical protein
MNAKNARLPVWAGPSHKLLFQLIVLGALLPEPVLGGAAPALPARSITTVAGQGKPGYSGDGGPATNATLANPYGIVRGPDGALYLCEVDNHVVRRLGREGVLSTVAGNGQRGYSGDGGPALAARLNEPYENHRVRVVR